MGWKTKNNWKVAEVGEEEMMKQIRKYSGQQKQSMQQVIEADSMPVAIMLYYLFLPLPLNCLLLSDQVYIKLS